MYMYIENEHFPSVKMAVFETEPHLFQVQLIDHQDCFYNTNNLNGRQVVKLAQAYGFDIPNPGMISVPFVEAQHACYS